MHRFLARAAVAAAALALLVPSAVAQTADDIIAKNLEAKGGVEKLRETNSVRITGTASFQGMQAPMVTLSKRPNLMRREMEVAGQKMVQGYDGTTLWMSVSGMPPQEMPAGPQAELLKRNADFDSAFLDWRKKGHTIEYKGAVTEGGRELHRLVMTPTGGPAIEYYIDAKTGLEAKTVIAVEDPNLKGKMETRFSDYRDVDGRMIPFTMTNYMDGTQVAQIKLDKVEFNVPLDDELFRMPKQ